MTESRQKLLLSLLGFVLLFALWNWLGPSGGDDAPEVGDDFVNAPPIAGRIPGAGRPATAKPAADTVEELRVADLAIQPREYSPGRDPWRFVDPPPPPEPPPPPPPRGPTPEELAAMRAAEERAAQLRAQQAAELAKPKPPPFTLSYLGNFGPESRRIAVFSDGKTIYNALEGETLAGKFIVADIGYESVDIRFVGFPDWPPQRLAVGPGANR
jgi:hypothetical protein